MTTRRLPALAALSAGLGLLLAGCAAPEPSAPVRSIQPSPSTSSSAAAPLSPLAPQGEPVVLAGELTTPWSLAFVDDAVLIGQRDTGEIVEVTGDATRVVGTVADIVQDGESGLLGIAVRDGRLYAYSTGPGGNRIQRFALDGAPGALSLGAAETILDGIPAASYHDGGRIAFGPDGMLYATTGDAGQREIAQDLGSLGGKILRLTPDGDVPADNPFADSLVYSYGHRNPQGIAWAADGTLFASEFGQDTWDELNIISPGANYGWPVVEGIARDGRFVDPVQQWSPDRASPSGVAVVGGTVFIANLRGQTLRAVPVDDPGASSEYFTGVLGRLRHVAPASDGGLYMLTSNTDGNGDQRAGDDRLLRIDLAPR